MDEYTQEIDVNTTEEPRHRKWPRRLGCCAGAFFFVVLILFGVVVFLAYRKGRSTEPPRTSIPRNFTAVRITQPATTANALIVTDDDPSVGPKDAAITIVEFSDFECPFCKQAFPIIRELMAQYGGRVRFVYRDFPVSQIHKNAQKAAEAGECANVQGKFWGLHDKIFQNAPAITVSDLKRYAQEAGLDVAAFTICLDSGQFAAEVQQDYADGVSLGVRGTPTWFINGRKVEGVIPRGIFVKVLDQLLAALPQK